MKYPTLGQLPCANVIGRATELIKIARTGVNPEVG